MAGEKYIVAALDNSVQIAIRNILNPNGFVFQERCSDPVVLLRLIRSYSPDFVIIDSGMQVSEVRSTLEAVDEQMLCAVIMLGEYKDSAILSMMEKSRTLSFCPKPLNRDLLLHTVDMALLHYRRLLGMDAKLRKIRETYEGRERIELAKSLLMQDGLSEREAYGMIRKRSMDERRSMKSIADSIIYEKRKY